MTGRNFLFIFASEKLRSWVSQICQLDKCCVIIGYFNCNLTDASLLCTSALSGFFYLIFDWLKFLPKNLDYTDTHYSSNVSNLDHVVSSVNLQVSSVHVVTDFQLSDHLQYLHLFLVFLLSLRPNPQPHQPQAQFYRDWKNLQGDLFEKVTNFVVHKTHVPFQLLMRSPLTDANKILVLLDIT